MLEIGWGKLVLIGIVALLVIGPKELPAVLRTMGQWMTKLRRMAAEFQSQFQEALREAELADLKKQVDEMSSTAQSYTNFDPLSDVRREFETTQHQIESAVTAPVPAKEGGAKTSSTAASATQPPLASSETHADAIGTGTDTTGGGIEPAQSDRGDREGKPA
ncbi:MAG: Sec-independent protein translocase protein TatB [Xanthobacteraceae bacterium]|jgi:sec-independent protein translocase protein TatB